MLRRHPFAADLGSRPGGGEGGEQSEHTPPWRDAGARLRLCGVPVAAHSRCHLPRTIGIECFFDSDSCSTCVAPRCTAPKFYLSDSGFGKELACSASASPLVCDELPGAGGYSHPHLVHVRPRAGCAPVPPDLLLSYNKRPEEFASSREYNDYLEEAESIGAHA